MYNIEIHNLTDADTTWHTTQAQTQLPTLRTELETARYSPTNTSRIPMLVGVGGTIFSDTMAAMNTLRVTTHDVEAALAKVHIATAQWLQKFCKCKIA